jgi:TM2 domain-containing membrane protein YozV
MRISPLLIFFCFFLLQKFSSAHTITGHNFVVLRVNELHTSLLLESVLESTDIKESVRPNPLLKRFRDKHKNTKKITAAILAFPLPFGIVGLHRIYLGCAPYVPVVYIASLGGAFGLLPLIDFCVILRDKTTEEFNNNKKVFMWVD